MMSDDFSKAKSPGVGRRMSFFTFNLWKEAAIDIEDCDNWRNSNIFQKNKPRNIQRVLGSWDIPLDKDTYLRLDEKNQPLVYVSLVPFCRNLEKNGKITLLLSSSDSLFENSWCCKNIAFFLTNHQKNKVRSISVNCSSVNNGCV